MAEGKTLAPTAPCDLCDEGDSVKHCVDCNQDLCLRCAKAHGKIEALCHHKLTPIENKGTSGARAKIKHAFCTEHTSKQLSVICEECLCAVCDTCASRAHKHHKLLRTNLNTTFLQRISAQKVPQFMDVLHDLEKEKDGSPVKLQLYKTARDMVKSWMDKLRKIIDQDAENLLKEIEKEIKKQEVLLADISTNLKDITISTDKQMSALTSARKIDDPEILLLNLHEGDRIIGKAKSLLNEIESTRKTYTIDDLLPFRNELNNVEKCLHNFFTFTQFEDDTTVNTQVRRASPRNYSSMATQVRRASPRNYSSMATQVGRASPRNYSSMIQKGKYHIGNCDGWAFRISETSHKNSKTVVIYDVGNLDLYEFDVDSKKLKQFRCTKNVCRMATVSDKCHVMVDIDNRDVHILNGNFDMVSTMKRDDENKGEIYGVYPLTANSFIYEQHKHSKTYFVEVTVSSKNTFNKRILCETDWVVFNGMFVLHSDNKRITMTSSQKVVRTLDLTTGKFTELNLASQIGGWIYYICVDEDDRILIGDSSGKIHLATSSKYEHELTNMKGNDIVGGISLRGGKVVTVVGDYINIYQ